VVPLLNRIGSGSQTWAAVAVARPALSALALLAFALCAGDYLPGLPAELAPPLDNGLGLMLMPAVAASAALPLVLWSHAQHADTARAGRGDRDRASRALPRPARPPVRSRRHRASHGGSAREARRGSRAHLDPCDPGIRTSRLLASRRTPHASAAACCHAAVTHSKSRGDERMSMARKALRKIGEAVPRSRMPSTGRVVAQAPAGRPRQTTSGRSRADRRPGQ
jgi:hypothetical protein